jgi:hypothetical protein
MKRFMMLAVATIAIALWVRLDHGSAAAQQKPGAPAVKWEYQVIRYPAPKGIDWDERLNREGGDGWEFAGSVGRVYGVDPSKRTAEPEGIVVLKRVKR